MNVSVSPVSFCQCTNQCVHSLNTISFGIAGLEPQTIYDFKNYLNGGKSAEYGMCAPSKKNRSKKNRSTQSNKVLDIIDDVTCELRDYLAEDHAPRINESLDCSLQNVRLEEDDDGRAGYTFTPAQPLSCHAEVELLTYYSSEYECNRIEKGYSQDNRAKSKKPTEEDKLEDVVNWISKLEKVEFREVLLHIVVKICQPIDRAISGWHENDSNPPPTIPQFVARDRAALLSECFLRQNKGSEGNDRLANKMKWSSCENVLENLCSRDKNLYAEFLEISKRDASAAERVAIRNSSSFGKNASMSIRPETSGDEAAQVARNEEMGDSLSDLNGKTASGQTETDLSLDEGDGSKVSPPKQVSSSARTPATNHPEEAMEAAKSPADESTLAAPTQQGSNTHQQGGKALREQEVMTFVPTSGKSRDGMFDSVPDLDEEAPRCDADMDVSLDGKDTPTHSSQEPPPSSRVTRQPSPTANEEGIPLEQVIAAPDKEIASLQQALQGDSTSSAEPDSPFCPSGGESPLLPTDMDDSPPFARYGETSFPAKSDGEINEGCAESVTTVQSDAATMGAKQLKRKRTQMIDLLPAPGNPTKMASADRRGSEKEAVNMQDDWLLHHNQKWQEFADQQVRKELEQKEQRLLEQQLKDQQALQDHSTSSKNSCSAEPDSPSFPPGGESALPSMDMDDSPSPPRRELATFSASSNSKLAFPDNDEIIEDACAENSTTKRTQTADLPPSPDNSSRARASAFGGTLPFDEDDDGAAEGAVESRHGGMNGTLTWNASLQKQVSAKDHKITSQAQPIEYQMSRMAHQPASVRNGSTSLGCICSICMEIIVEGTAVVPCGHVYCERCLQDCTECPNCRLDIQKKLPIKKVDDLVKNVGELQRENDILRKRSAALAKKVEELQLKDRKRKNAQNKRQEKCRQAKQKAQAQTAAAIN